MGASFSPISQVYNNNSLINSQPGSQPKSYIITDQKWLWYKQQCSRTWKNHSRKNNAIPFFIHFKRRSGETLIKICFVAHSFTQPWFSIHSFSNCSRYLFTVNPFDVRMTFSSLLITAWSNIIFWFILIWRIDDKLNLKSEDTSIRFN